MKKVKCLLLGYLGENNTGCESRLLTIAEDLRATVGSNIELTAAVLNKNSVARYTESKVIKSDDIKLIEYNYFYIFDLLFLIPRYDLLVIVEAGCFTDHFCDLFLYEFLWATWVAKIFKKKVVAYAVDCDELKTFNQKLVKRVANKMDLIITRTEDAKNKLVSYGVKKAIKVTADTVFQYQKPGECYRKKLIDTLDLDLSKPVIGIAPKEFFWWPVKINFLGKRSNLYHYPYFFSWEKGSKTKSKEVKKMFALYADYCVEKYDAQIVYICMEHMDYGPSKDIFYLMKHQDAARMIPSDIYTADDIINILGIVKLLVSTRYHACVLSMTSAIPMIAVSHDIRCESMFKEMNLREYCLDYLTPDLLDALIDKTEKLFSAESEHKKIINDNFNNYLNKSAVNRKVFKEWFYKNFPDDNGLRGGGR